MNKALIFLLFILVLIVACNKEDPLSQTVETSKLEINTSVDHKVEEIVEKSEELLNQPEVKKDFPWHDCSPLKKQELLDICPSLDQITSKYNEELKLCEVRMSSSTVSFAGVGINVEEQGIEKAKETFERRTKVMEDNQTIRNLKIDFGGKLVSYEKFISSSQQGQVSGTWRDIVDLNKGKNVARIQAVPSNSCPAIKELAKKVFVKL